jgi:nitrogen fixation protein FixH
MSVMRMARRRRTGWNWFPWWVTAALLVVIVVNAGMVWTALRTFPGAAGADGFDLSNNYNKVLAAEARQQALGWHVAVGLSDGDRVHVGLSGPGNAPLPGATLAATAERPIGPKDPIPLRFQEEGPGRFLALGQLPRGQWNVLLTVRAAGRRYTTAVRLVADSHDRR